MLYVSGRISTQTLIEQTTINNAVNIEAYKAALATNHGGTASDYCIFTLEDNSTEATRLKRGDECVFVWENDAIVGVDFSIEDNRKLFMIKTVDPDNKTIVKDIILGDDTDSLIIQTRVCLADGTTIDTSVNASALIPVMVPDGRVIYLKSTITNGVGAEMTFKTALEGIWSVVPTKIMVGNDNMRLWGDNGPGSNNTINVLMNI